jgi:hypothetical protein
MNWSARDCMNSKPRMNARRLWARVLSAFLAGMAGYPDMLARIALAKKP